MKSFSRRFMSRPPLGQINGKSLTCPGYPEGEKVTVIITPNRPDCPNPAFRTPGADETITASNVIQYKLSKCAGAGSNIIYNSSAIAFGTELLPVNAGKVIGCSPETGGG